MPTIHEKRIKEGFPKQRLVVLPPTVVERCRSMPIVSNLYVTDIGAYASAAHHYVERQHGIAAAVLIYCLSGRGLIEIDNTIQKIRSRAIRNHPTQHPAYLPGGSERTHGRSAGYISPERTLRRSRTVSNSPCKIHSSTCPIPASCATPSKTCTPA